MPTSPPRERGAPLRRGRFFIYLVVGLAAAWPAVVLGMGLLYSARLLHPACLPSTTAPPRYQPVRLQTAAGLELDGWWQPPQNGAVILLLGGHGANRDAMLPEAGLLAEGGYGVLTISYRHCAGKAATLGAREKEEVAAMAQFAQQQPGVDRLGLLGFSGGGAAGLCAAAEIPSIRAIIAEGNYASLLQELSAGPAPPSLEWQLRSGVVLGYFLTTGVWPGRVRPVDCLAQLQPRPVLMVHGAQEAARTRAGEQAAAGGTTTSLWIVPRATHGAYASEDPDGYRRRVLEFFDLALQADR